MVLGSGIRDPRSGIRKKPIPDPGSRGQKGTGSRIRIRNNGENDVRLGRPCEAVGPPDAGVGEVDVALGGLDWSLATSATNHSDS